MGFLDRLFNVIYQIIYGLYLTSGTRNRDPRARFL